MARPGDTAAALARVAARLTTTTSNSAAASHALSSWQVLSPHSPSCSSSSSRSPWQPLPGWPPHSGYASSAARRPPPEGAQASRGGNSSGSSSSSSSNDRSRQLPALTRYGHDLTEEARRGLLDPVIGRADVIQRTMQVCSRRGMECAAEVAVAASTGNASNTGNNS
jgi:ATP-dependent Clp protease ATP-binding subunit ClpA